MMFEFDRRNFKVGYHNYIADGTFESVELQKNIMLLVGNGFDIQCLKALKVQGSTRYENFYYYLLSKGITPESNILQKLMKEKKARGDKDWSDFECAIMEYLSSNRSINANKLKKDLKEIQNLFAEYLNELITPNVIKGISKKINERNSAIEGLQKFLGDLSEKDYRKLRFKDNLTYYVLYNVKVMNFNYTTLFDNYIYLDKDRFDPHPYKEADRNFMFDPNPKDISNIKLRETIANKKTSFSSYLMLDIDHPHGSQFIPKSMLFGFDDESKVSELDKNVSKTFLKHYWTQGDKKYRHLFSDTDLFILFGLSLGETDSWWWKNIIDALSNNEAKGELIIYLYNDSRSEDDIKNEFIGLYGKNIKSNLKEFVKEKISIINYKDEDELKAFKLN